MIHPLRQNLSSQLLKVVLFVLATLLVLLIWGTLTGAQAQQTKRFANQPTTQGADVPLYSNYKGVQIGMTADEVRAKLGEPKELADAQFFYVFSEKETAQIFFDQMKKVKAISIDYIGEESGAPGCSAVVGIQVQPMADGSVYKLIRYPKLGYWVSYNRTAGTTPIITVTIQKI
jgi:outer membrane protein assembly factor BamE (lipoprotein component of BamABCDE complex)